MSLRVQKWFVSGEPWVWLHAAAVSFSLILVLGLIALISVNGLSHFWPAPLMEAELKTGLKTDFKTKPGQVTIIGEIKDTESSQKLYELDTESNGSRILIKIGNRDLNRLDFVWVAQSQLNNLRYPKELLTIERREWGNLYGRLVALNEHNKEVIRGSDALEALKKRLDRSNQLVEQIEKIEKHEIGRINYQLEKLRLKQKRLKMDQLLTTEIQAFYQEQESDLKEQYQQLQSQLLVLNEQLHRDSAIIQVSDGEKVTLPLAKIVQVYQPNAMTLMEKLAHYFKQLWRFVSDDPREANTEGGVFPAIFGTVIMVIIMSIIVTPLGVVAGIYLHEYANQGLLTRIIRIAVNNLAGVPSIVYGVFGLGFFVYFLGGSLDALFYPEASPAPVFGTPGLLWASITLAILTLPVVIVSTEEGLARIPKSIREGSLALGATRAETLLLIILPMASPAMMTGLILAVARAAGEVAPLMLVGVVKLAPSLAIDANAPFLHLERKFMHLGFHIYDVGLQSPNIEAARPLVFATSLLLVVVIIMLNITAITLRNRLREKYKGLEE